MKIPKRVLIVCMRRLGDVLLTTPLAASFRAAWPGVRIDWLVFESTAGILQDNPAADAVFTTPDRPSIADTFAIMRRIARQYDLAVAAQSGDRPAFCARVASPQAFCFSSAATGGSLRDRWMTATAIMPTAVHRVEQVLALAGLIGVERTPDILVPKPQEHFQKPAADYVVLHPGAAFVYKHWTAQGWRELAQRFLSRGTAVAVTGGASAAESRYLDQIFDGVNVTRYDGALTWPQMSALVKNARLFVGVDTSVTHLAAALGTQTYAIFGPTDDRIWRPWNARQPACVHLIQNHDKPCLPCHQEGCDRHIQSRSACLDELGVDVVWKTILNQSA